MQMNGNGPRVIVVYGPMFAGKSTELISRADYSDRRGYRKLVIKFAGDNRYDETHVVSHDKAKVTAMPVRTLSEVGTELIELADNIFIDEGQFFPDLMNFIERVRKTKNVRELIIAGLDLNHKRQNFGQMKEAIETAECKIQLTARCVECNDHNGRAVFTRMTVRDPELRKADIAVGGAEMYHPVCEHCYELTASQ